MNAHLLSLSTLEAAAPGVLEVVFGPDGDFEGAPKWSAPLWCVDAKGVSSHFEVYDWPPQDAWPESYHFDLRLPSVAARLAGLCAQALSRFGSPDPAQVWLHYDGNGLIHLMVEDRSLYSLDHDPFWTKQGNIDYGAFVGAMTSTLAPRIAALRKP